MFEEPCGVGDFEKVSYAIRTSGWIEQRIPPPNTDGASNGTGMMYTASFNFLDEPFMLCPKKIATGFGINAWPDRFGVVLSNTGRFNRSALFIASTKSQAKIHLLCLLVHFWSSTLHNPA